MTSFSPSSESAPTLQDGHSHHHIIPLKTYILVWGALMVLTVLTVIISRFDFGPLNTLIAVLVATIKGTLVALYFMHLRYDNKFNLIILLGSLFFVVIFFVPTLIDLTTRGDAIPIRNELPANSIFYIAPQTALGPTAHP